MWSQYTFHAILDTIEQWPSIAHLAFRIMRAIVITLCPMSVGPSSQLAFRIVIFSSETTMPIGTKLCRNYVCDISTKSPHFVLSGKNMAVMGNFCF